MGLDRVVFQEQLDSLAIFYPTDKIEISDQVLEGWWPVFKDFETGDFLRGVIAVRGSSRRFPTAGILETAVREAKKKRAREDLNERMAQHKQVKKEEAQYFRSSKGTYNQAQTHDCFRAIMMGLSDGNEAGALAMEKLAEKYPENKSGLLECAETFRKCRMRPGRLGG